MLSGLDASSFPVFAAKVPAPESFGLSEGSEVLDTLVGARGRWRSGRDDDAIRLRVKDGLRKRK
jgi:hypothetical protein